MKIIPVLDLLDGQVVLGVAGLRKIYRPIEESFITDSAIPLEVVRNFEEKLKLTSFYIADLDLIQQTGKSNLVEVIEICKKGYSVMLDGGCRSLTDISNILDSEINQVIIGTETIDSIKTIKEAVKRYGEERIIISIDLKEGKLLSQSTKIAKYSPIEIAKLVEKLGIKSIIVLDLKKIGSQEGPITKTVLEILEKRKNINIITGGGVRYAADLFVLADMGIEGALIATAFHKGKITRNDLEKFVLWNL